MDLHLGPVERAFLGEVDAFIAAHWPASNRPDPNAPATRPLDPGARDAWFRALAGRGWLAPQWPVAWGGTDWSVAQHVLWERQTARAGTPQPDPAGYEVVGPLVWAFGSPAQRRRVLPALVPPRGAGPDPAWSGNARWRLALAPPHGDPPLRVRRVTEGFELSGTLPVSADSQALGTLCQAGHDDGVAGSSLFLLTAPLRTCDGVHLGREGLLGRVGDAGAQLGALPALTGAGRLLAWRGRMASQRLRNFAATVSEGTGTLAEEPAFRRKLTQLELDITGLEALEQRALHEARLAREPGRLRAVLERCRASVQQQLTDLQRESLGYYALPYADPLGLHNEGPIGPAHAREAVAAWLACWLAPDAGPGTAMDR